MGFITHSDNNSLMIHFVTLGDICVAKQPGHVTSNVQHSTVLLLLLLL